VRICVSFSGGRSSAYMCQQLLKDFPYAEFAFVFANTGQEAEATLEFVDRCDRHFGLNLAWVEAVVHYGKRSGCTHKLVNYKVAARNGEPYEAVIKKYGLPNVDWLHCTRELKTNPMYDYIASLGWAWGTYKVALGIRADEPKRISKSATENNIVYPLVERGVEKSDVIEFWRKMPFDLQLEEREGNCKWCFKKSDRKHIQNLHANPEWYEFPARMEQLYANQRLDLIPEPRTLFRKNRTTLDMVKLARLTGPVNWRKDRADEDAGCSESCEPDFERDKPNAS